MGGTDRICDFTFLYTDSQQMLAASCDLSESRYLKVAYSMSEENKKLRKMSIFDNLISFFKTKAIQVHFIRINVGTFQNKLKLRRLVVGRKF